MSKMEIIYLVGGILVGIFGALVPLFRKLAKRTETEIDDKILDIAIQAVNFVDKHFLDKSGASKKALATELITREVKKAGETVTETVVDKAIEKAWAVNEINGAIAKEEEEKEKSDMGK